MDLKDKNCMPCEGGIPALSAQHIQELTARLDSGWKVEHDKRLIKEYTFVNFRHTMHFVNRVAELAEEEGHHPDLHVYYGKCIVELWTHAIGGLSENDFIMAAKIDGIQMS